MTPVSNLNQFSITKLVKKKKCFWAIYHLLTKCKASDPKLLNVGKVHALKKTANGRVFLKKWFANTAGKSCIRYSVTTLIPSTNLETTGSKRLRRKTWEKMKKKSYILKAHKIVQVYLFFSCLLLVRILNSFALDGLEISFAGFLQCT